MSAKPFIKSLQAVDHATAQGTQKEILDRPWSQPDSGFSSSPCYRSASSIGGCLMITATRCKNALT